MDTIGTKILEIRKRKGFTQEELSDLSKINLRTLQRIEKGDTEPRSDTLKRLCDVLGINMEDILDAGKVEDRSVLVWLHLSVVSGCFIPLGNIIVPLILWITKKDKVIFLKEQGANILNFQIIWTALLFFVSVVLMTVQMEHMLHAQPYNLGEALLYPMLAQIIVNVTYPIIISILIRKGHLQNYYPTLIRFVK